ncbi:hypothetical protein Sjap_010951 [Stephania japonica]|uniref:GHMP kinase C-terminal domain-containing protein n=1 Tax=Stephania japonica TaxID=461633 RepID=A0AAP0P517_9MAGN
MYKRTWNFVGVVRCWRKGNRGMASGVPGPVTGESRGGGEMREREAVSDDGGAVQPKPLEAPNLPSTHHQQPQTHHHHYEHHPLLRVSVDPHPIYTSVQSFAPATVANLGPGFDFLGCAVSGLGDTVTLRLDPRTPPAASPSPPSPPPPLHRPPLQLRRHRRHLRHAPPPRLLRRPLPLPPQGPPLRLRPRLQRRQRRRRRPRCQRPLGNPLPPSQLILAGLDSEAKVSGFHADNIAPAILGGFVLIRSYHPLDLIPLKFPDDKELFFVLVTPEFEAPTKEMRAALPAEVGMREHVWNCSQAGGLVAAVLQGDVEGLGKALSADRIVEPRRAPLIPGMAGVKRAAIEAGAFGCTISGAGPTAVAVTDREEKGVRIGESMVEAFWREGRLKASASVQRLDRVGARVVSRSP